MKPHTRLLPIALLTGFALAGQANPLSLSLQQSLVRQSTVGGKVTEQFVANPKGVQPGAVVSQVVTALNTGDKTLKSVNVSLPIPKGTHYLGPERTLNTYPTQYSIDGGKTFASAPLKRKVTLNENGKSVTKEVEVKPSEYTAVRWTIPEVAVGASQRVGFRVQVR